MTIQAATAPSSRMVMGSLAVLAAAVLLINLGDPLGLHQNDEDHYYGIARAMKATGDWVVPTFMGQPAFQKPPLLYWLMAASMRALGDTLFAARLPTALCAVMLVLLTARVARAYSAASAVLAGALVATTFGIFQYGRAAMMDVPLALTTLVALAGLRTAAEGKSSGPYTVSAAAALATLLKGPIGALLIAVPGSVWWLTSRRDRERTAGHGKAHWAAALGVGMVVTCAWPVLLWRRGLADQWWNAFIVGENLGKFSGAGNSAVSMLGGFALLLLPWTAIALIAAGRTLQRTAWRDANVRLVWLFVAANVVLFSLPAIKWAQYLLPTIPMVALLVARATRDGLTPAFRVAGTLTAIGLVASAAVALLALRIAAGRDEQALLLVLAVSLLIAGVAALHARHLAGCAVAIGGALVVVAIAAPRLTLDRPPVSFIAAAAGKEIVTFGVPPYRLTNLLGRPVGAVRTAADLQSALDRGALAVVADSERFGLDEAKAPVDAAGVCWPTWKRRIQIMHVWGAIVSKDRESLVESVCLVSRF